MNAAYKNPDNDSVSWMSGSPVAPGAVTHQGMVYAIQHPFTGEMLYPSNAACWRYDQEKMFDYMSKWCEYKLEDIHDEEQRAKVCGIKTEDVRNNVKAIVLAKSLEESKKEAELIYKRGQWPRFYFTNGGKGGIRRKVYLDSVGGKLTTNFYSFEDCGHTDEAKKEIKNLFGGSAPFDTPKPTRLLQRILQIATDQNSIILDSFAGSGTTAHAVLNLNKADGGNRKFILVEMEDYAENITAERVRRVMAGYGEGKNAVEGTGGGFSFYELGEPLFNEMGELNPAITTAQLRRYVWHSEVHAPFVEDENRKDKYLLGINNGVAYYFFHEEDTEVSLSNQTANEVTTIADAYIIYADACQMSDELLKQNHITFKKFTSDVIRF